MEMCCAVHTNSKFIGQLLYMSYIPLCHCLLLLLPAVDVLLIFIVVVLFFVCVLLVVICMLLVVKSYVINYYTLVVCSYAHVSD